MSSNSVLFLLLALFAIAMAQSSEESCIQKVSQFASSFCPGPCQEGFSEFAEMACQTSQTDEAIRNACCSVEEQRQFTQNHGNGDF